MSVERTKIDSILEWKQQKQQENLLKEALLKMVNSMQETEKENLKEDITDKQPQAVFLQTF